MAFLLPSPITPLRRSLHIRANCATQTSRFSKFSMSTETPNKSNESSTNVDPIDNVLQSLQSSEPEASPKKPQYSLRTRLREETEAPFRKARMFVYGGSAVSAGVGAFIASLRILAAAIGVSGVQPLSETIPNVAINLSVVAVCALLLRAETKAGERRLERMSRGARIANLRIEDAVTRQVIRLKDVRGRSRVVLVAGAFDAVSEAMQRAEEVRDGLSKSNLVIIPAVMSSESSSDIVQKNWRMTPFGIEEWKKWYQAEKDNAKAKLEKKADSLLVLIIRLDGKVGARSFGTPVWTKLIDEIANMPLRDPYGKP